MTEANPQGADLHTAADRIGSILDPKPQPEVEAQPETAPEVTEQETAPEQATTEASDSPQEAETQEAQTQSDFSSIQELADAVGVPIDEFLGKIKGKVKINGVEQEVTLADMRNGYQMEADYRRKTSELAEQRKAFEAEREQVAQNLSYQYAQAQQVTGILEQQLTAEYQAVDWNDLRVTDPAEFAAKKQEFNERYNYVQGLKANVQTELQRQAEEAQNKQAYGLHQMLQEESQRLAEAIPEFKDEAKAKVVKAEIKEFLKGLGYSDQEIGNVYDHRHVMILKDALEYRKLKSKGVEVKNKVVTAPKLLKPGSNESRSDSSQGAIRDKIARLKKSGRVEDAAALIKL
jgi:hypothetical protein